MRLALDVNLTFANAPDPRLDEILRRLAIIQGKQNTMSETLNDLETEVAENTSASNSAVTLIEGIAARIEAAGVDKVKLAALVSELSGNSDRLGAAVAANTPAEEPPVDPTV